MMCLQPYGRKNYICGQTFTFNKAVILPCKGHIIDRKYQTAEEVIARISHLIKIMIQIALCLFYYITIIHYYYMVLSSVGNQPGFFSLLCFHRLRKSNPLLHLFAIFLFLTREIIFCMLLWGNCLLNWKIPVEREQMRAKPRPYNSVQFKTASPNSNRWY